AITQASRPVAIASFQRRPGSARSCRYTRTWEYSASATGGGGASASGGGLTTARAVRATGDGAVRAAYGLRRRAGRSTTSLTTAMMTGVIAVAQIVPAAHSLETTVAATTEATAAATRVLTCSPPDLGGGDSVRGDADVGRRDWA